MFGNRGIYHEGWYANTRPIEPSWVLTKPSPADVVNGFEWELYDLSRDWTQNDDLAKKNPDKLRQMKELFLVEATKYNVFPLDASKATRLVIPRPSTTAGRSVFTFSGELSGLPGGSAPSLLNRSYTIAADVVVPEKGAEGMLNTNGGRFGGYGLYLLKGKPVFTWNLLDLQRVRWEGKEALTPGKHVVAFDFTYDGPGMGKGGTGVLKVDGKAVATRKMARTLPLILQWDETFDVGVDTGTPVDDADYKCPFRFTGKLEKLTVKLGPSQLMPAEKKDAARKVGARD